jgi:hypothetical protein
MGEIRSRKVSLAAILRGRRVAVDPILTDSFIVDKAWWVDLRTCVGSFSWYDIL